MWSVRNAMHQIGNAVAPPLEEDEDIDSDEEIQSDDEDSVPKFGLVGIISRALDRKDSDDEEIFEEESLTGGSLTGTNAVIQKPLKDSIPGDELDRPDIKNEQKLQETEDNTDGTDGELHHISEVNRKSPTPKLLRRSERESGSLTPSDHLRSSHHRRLHQNGSGDSISQASSLHDGSLRSIPESRTALVNERLFTENTGIDPLLGSPSRSSQHRRNMVPPVSPKAQPSNPVKPKASPTQSFSPSVQNHRHVEKHHSNGSNGSMRRNRRTHSNSSRNSSGSSSHQRIRLASIPILEEDSQTLGPTALQRNPSDANDKPPRSPLKSNDNMDSSARSGGTHGTNGLPDSSVRSGGTHGPMDASNRSGASHSHRDTFETTRQLERKCESLQEEVVKAKQEISSLRKAHESHIQYKKEAYQTENDLEKTIQTLTDQLQSDKQSYQAREQELMDALQQAQEQARFVQDQATKVVADSDSSFAKTQRESDRTLRVVQDKLASCMAQLEDERAKTQTMESQVTALQVEMETIEQMEDELEQVHEDYENCKHHVTTLESEMNNLKEKLRQAQTDADEMPHLRMKLRMIHEEREREHAHSQSATKTAASNVSQLEQERAHAHAEAQDVKQQLEAARADLVIIKSDLERSQLANSNLQRALESFSSEREDERSILEADFGRRQKALEAAQDAKIVALHQSHAAELEQLHRAGDAAVQHSMEQIRDLERKAESYRVDNVQMRRSLDEAIHRLDQTQEDVIDRVAIKNIVLDWLHKQGKKEQQQVLEVMASLLHFSEKEKEDIALHRSSGLGKVVDTLRAPLPPPKADLETLEGDNVRDKWVNFLLAETEE